MGFPAQDLIREAQDILVDATGVRWPATELVRWLNAAQLMLAEKRPDAYPKRADVPLVVGVRQSLPAEALKLMDIPANTSGAPVRQADRSALDAVLPGWRQAAGAATVKNWMHDPREPLVFEVYPPAASGASLSVFYAVEPTALPVPGGAGYATVTGTVQANPLFRNALRDAVLYLAYSKDAEHPANAARAQAHLAAFRAAIGDEVQATAAVTPRPENSGQPNA